MTATQIRQSRSAKGLSQTKLSKMTGIPQTTISGWESGLPPLHPILKAITLAQTLESSVEQLFAVAADEQ